MKRQQTRKGKAESPREGLSQREKFAGLEVGRAFAAIFVILSHASAIMAQPRFFGVQLWDGRLEKFGAGVDFFFVLSGFIISWAHWSDIGDPARIAHYASRRFRRIYPPYWGILIPLFLAYLAMPWAGTPSQHDPINFLFSLALLPYPEHPVLGVAWTLVYEIFFYGLFGLLIWAGRKAIPLLYIWAIGIIAYNLADYPASFPLSFLFDSLNLEFLLGVLAAWVLRRFKVRVPFLLATLGISAFVLLMLLRYPVLDHPLLSRLGYGLAASVAIIGLVAGERNHGLKVPRFLRLLGAASYAIYLIHGIALSIVIQILVGASLTEVPLPLVLTILTAGGVLAGLFYHQLVEKPLGRFVANAFRTRASEIRKTA
jgi:peptidoglycan/LPS O-acetylase OafA/YrhL